MANEYTRRKIESDREIATLEYCALKKTTGFAEILAYGMPEFTAEATVVRRGDDFSEAAQAAAHLRLRQAGLDVDDNGRIEAARPL